MSQRLVKKLCPKCKKPYEASDIDKKILGVNSEKDLILYRPTGVALVTMAIEAGQLFMKLCP